MRRSCIFISYSHFDREWLDKLKLFLKPFERAGLLEPWDDTQIKIGSDWRAEIRSALDRARVAVLVITQHFLASDFIANEELPRILIAQEATGLTIFPLIAGHSTYKHELLSKFQAANDPATPLESLDLAQQNEVLVRVVANIREILEPSIRPMIPSAIAGHETILFNLPTHHVPLILGRDSLLGDLSKAVCERRIQALIGPPGIGKTWVTLAYAETYRSQYDAIFWLPASKTETLLANWESLATLLGLSVSDDSLPERRNRVKVRLTQVYIRWLMIFDGTEDAASLADWIPHSNSGHVLLSSSVMNGLDKLGIYNPLQLSELSPEDGFQLLIRRTGRTDLTDEESSAARTLAHAELGCFPLAIEQAGSYIQKTFCSFSDYLLSYHNQQMDLLNLGVPNDYPSTLLGAVAQTLERFADSYTLQLARIIAVFDEDAIPRSFVLATAKELFSSGTLMQFEVDPLRFDELIAPVLGYSLAAKDLSTGDYRMHNLIRLAVRQLASKAELEEIDGAVVRGCGEAMEEVNLFNADRLLSPYGLSCARRILRRGIKNFEDARLLTKAAYIHAATGKVVCAKKMLESARDLLLRERGAKDRHSLSCALMLAEVRSKGLNPGSAIPLYEEVLKNADEERDADITAVALNNLGEIVRGNNDFRAALNFHGRSLAIRRKILGEGHLAVATALNNIGNVYSDMGDLSDDVRKLQLAHSYYEKSYTMRKAAVKAPHRLLANSLNNIGNVRLRLKWFKTAEPPLKEALMMWEGLGGPANEIAITLHNLSGLFKATKRKAESQDYAERAKEMEVRVLEVRRAITATEQTESELDC